MAPKPTNQSVRIDVSTSPPDGSETPASAAPARSHPKLIRLGKFGCPAGDEVDVMTPAAQPNVTKCNPLQLHLVTFVI